MSGLVAASAGVSALLAETAALPMQSPENGRLPLSSSPRAETLTPEASQSPMLSSERFSMLRRTTETATKHFQLSGSTERRSKASPISAGRRSREVLGSGER